LAEQAGLLANCLRLFRITQRPDYARMAEEIIGYLNKKLFDPSKPAFFGCEDFLRREELNKLGVTRAIDLREIRNGVWVRVAGWVIVRQRPGTAKGFLFLSMEDETGIANVIVTPNVYDHNRSVLVSEPLLLIDGVLQNQDGVIHVKAGRIPPLSYAMTAGGSHDFH